MKKFLSNERMDADPGKLFNCPQCLRRFKKIYVIKYAYLHCGEAEFDWDDCCPVCGFVGVMLQVWRSQLRRFAVWLIKKLT